MDGQIIIGTELDTSMLDSQIDLLTDKLQGLVEEYKILEEAEPFEGQQEQLIKLGSEIDTTRKKLDKLVSKKEELNKNEFEGLNGSIKSIGKGTDNLIRKITKWGLAVFGIRSAYNFVRQSVSTLSQYNDQLATDIEYIRFALASTLQPIIEWMVNLVFKLLAYVNYLAQAWFGINLFANASAKNMNKMVGSAKQLNKQLAGFDEMNVLSDESSSSTNNTLAPSVDLSKTGIDDIPIPEWLVWIKDNWALVVAGIIGIVGAITLFSAIKSNKIAKVGTSFTGFFDSLGKGIEAIAILGGLALLIKSVTELIDVFSQSGLSLWEVLGLLGGILLTIVGFMGSIALLGPAMSAGLLPFSVLIAGISAILIVMALTLPTILEAIESFISGTAPAFIGILTAIGTAIESIIYALGTALPPILDSVGGLFEKIFGGIEKIILSVGKVLKDILNALESLVANVLNSIVNFINRLGPAINNFVDNSIVAATKLINFMISGIEYLINTLLISGINALIDGINSISQYVGFTIPRAQEMQIPRFVPRLARGGIVNNPGPGVMMGSYVAGERGPEAVIPLDDETLDRLGLAFARHTEINATVPVYVGNRQVAREIKRINAENDFSYNS